MKKHLPVFIFLILYCVFFTYLPYILHLDLRTSLFDFGLEKQVIWNTAYGRLFQGTVETGNYLGDHFSPIILPIAMIFRLFPYDITLFFLQTLSVCFFLLGVYRIALKELNTRWLVYALFIAAAFYRGLNGLLLFDFHPVAFAPAFLIWGIYNWIWEKRYTRAWILFGLALACKEDVGLFVFMLGIYLMIFRRKDSPKKASALLGLTGLTVSLLSILVIIPYFRGEVTDSILRYSQFGSSPAEVAGYLITHPGEALEFIFEKQKVYYLERMSKPVAFLSVFSPSAILTFPSLAINLLSNNWACYSGQYHYDGIFAVGLFLSGILGMSNLLRFFSNKWKKSNVYLPWLLILILLVINTPLLIKHRAWRDLASEKPNLQKRVYQKIDAWKKRIPEGNIVATDYPVGAHFGDWKNLQLYFPHTDKYPDKPDYIIVTHSSDSLLQKKIDNDLNHGYSFIDKGEDIWVLMRYKPQKE